MPQKRKNVTVEVLVGTLQIEWPPGAKNFKAEKQFQRGDVLKMSRDRAVRLGSSVRITEV